MNFLSSIKLYISIIPIFFGIDILWLGVIAKNFYQKYLGYIMRSPINWTPATLFYGLFVIGVIIFAILPALEKKSLQTAIMYGALFGYFTYSTYDLSNYATIQGWPFIVVIVDILWGITISTIISICGYLIAQKFFIQ